MSKNLKPVTRNKPCLACGKPDWCAWSPDGKRLVCARSTTPPPGMHHIGECEGGTVFGFTADRESNGHADPLHGLKIGGRCTGDATGAPKQDEPEPVEQVNPREFVERTGQAITDQLRGELAEHLGVRVDSVKDCGVGWADTDDLRLLHAGGKDWRGDWPTGGFVMPERDGSGAYCGVGIRTTDGRKGAASGSTGLRRGLFVSPLINHADDRAVLAVEGASDVLALHALGVPAVGRPSNTSGAAALAEMFEDRPVIVVGERDGKSDGTMPGRNGAKRSAQKLANAWDGEATWSMVPAGCKDVRDWLRQRVEDGLDLNDLAACTKAGAELVEAIVKQVKTVKPAKKSQAEKLVDLAMERYRFAVTDDGKPFAVELDGPNVADMFRQTGCSLRAKLAKTYRKAFGTTPNASALSDAMTALHGEALDAQPEAVHLRVAKCGAGIVIDLGDRDGRAVVVDEDGWQVLSRSPVLFQRTALTGALPVPTEGGDLDTLRELLNVTDETWPLVVGFIVAALVPAIPHPVLLLGGEQGTGKSSAARVIVGTFDPSPAPLRSQPKEEEQWVMSASGSWAVAVDNISHIPAWWSDALCKAVTGDGWVRRKLYTDGDLAVITFRRVIILTSIDAGALRGDLGDRLLMLELETIGDAQRMTEAELDRRLAEVGPGVFGCVLTLLSGTLRELPGVKLDESPRMADFARVLAALDAATAADGGTAGTLESLPIYLGQRDEIAAAVVGADPVASAACGLVERQHRWEGTCETLLEVLTPTGVIPKGWPRSASSLGAALRRCAPALNRLDVNVTFSKGPRPKRERRVLLYAATKDAPAPKSAENAVPAVPPVPQPASEAGNDDSGRTAWGDGKTDCRPPGVPPPSAENQPIEPETQGGDAGDGGDGKSAALPAGRRRVQI